MAPAFSTARVSSWKMDVVAYSEGNIAVDQRRLWEVRSIDGWK